MGIARPELSIKEAAKACGVSDKTIRRNLDKFPHAHRLDSPSGPEAGPWVIPVTDLIAAGYQPGKPSDPETEPPQPRTGTEAAELRKRISELEAAQAESQRRETELRHRAELAEAIAGERGQALEDTRRALRMLEVGSGHQNAPEAETPTAAPDTRPDAARERATGWLRRTFGR